MTSSLLSLSKAPLPLSANRVWRSYRGGRLLDLHEGRPNPEDSHYPEDWIGSAVRAINPAEHAREDEGLSTATLENEAVRIDQLFADHGEYFFGQEHIAQFGHQPEFLVKFIDSAERLHFQCHPSKAFSRANLDSSYGKFEAYYVLDVRPEMGSGEVFIGFQRPPTRQELKSMIERQNIAAIQACFDPIHVHRGDVLIVPGGVPHALGAGVLLVEILEPSDWVARFEYQRGDYVLPEKDRFMGRDIDFALGMFDLCEKSADNIQEHYICSAEPIHRVTNARRLRLIGPDQTDCFQVWKTTWRGQTRRTVNSYCIAIVVEGSCRLGGPEGWTAELGLYDRVAIPHGIKELKLESAEGCALLECYPPHSHPENETFIA